MSDEKMSQDEILRRADAIREFRRVSRLKPFVDLKLHFEDPAAKDKRGHIRTTGDLRTKGKDIEKMANAVFQKPLDLALEEYKRRLKIAAETGVIDYGVYLDPQFYDLSDKRKKG